MLANNLANIETGGYKADREFFSLYTGEDAYGRSPDRRHLHSPVIRKPMDRPLAGIIHQTANPLDFAIEGEGMFAVQTANGVRYTRNGNFRLSHSGTLTSSDGSPLLRKAAGSSQYSMAFLSRCLPDGTVQQDGQVIGQMQVASFDPESSGQG